MLQLQALCKEADPHNFKKVQVIKLSYVFYLTLLIYLNCLKSEDCFPLFILVIFFLSCRNGSVVAESVAEYNYPNNETQIQFLNTQLDAVLTDILNDTSNLNKVSQAFNNSSVTLYDVTFQPTEIKSKLTICHF